MTANLQDIADARELARSGMGRMIRQNAGLTHREVAAVVGASPSSVHRWENGQRVPRSPAGLRWAKEMRRLVSGQRGHRES